MVVPQNQLEKAIERLNKSINVPCWVKEAREYNRKLKALITGEDFEHLLGVIFTVEDDQKAKLRKLFARPIKDLNETIFSPINNVFTATGGNKEFKLNKKTVKEKFFQTIENIKDGKSVSKWLETYWIKTLYHSDPNGLIFMEHSNGIPYQTYKSIQSIRNYEATGQLVKWVAFEPESLKVSEFNEKYNYNLNYESSVNINVWRYCDEFFDYLFIEKDKQFILIEELTYINPFKECPGVINSEIESFEDEGMRLSPIDCIVELEEEILRDVSIKIAFKFRDGIPIPWRYAHLCHSCNGTGKGQKDDVCPDCGGYGEYKTKSAITEIVLPLPKEGEQKIAPDLGGFVYPPVEIWKQYNEEIQSNSDKCYLSIWGKLDLQITNETATSRILDEQSKVIKLDKYSSAIEWIEQKICNWVAIYLDPTLPINENHCIIRYGRNYILDSADVILAKYSEAKTKETPTTILDRLLSEYLTVKYRNNPDALYREIEKIKIEPYVHMTIEQISSKLGFNEVKKKIIFNEWWKDLDTDLIKTKTIEVLKSEYETYFAEQSKKMVSSDEANTLKTNDEVWDKRYKSNLCTQNEMLIAIGLPTVENGDIRISEIPTRRIPLVSKFGVNDFSALIQLLTTENVQNKGKLIEILFGITEEDANNLITKKEAI